MTFTPQSKMYSKPGEEQTINLFTLLTDFSFSSLNTAIFNDQKKMNQTLLGITLPNKRVVQKANKSEQVI